MKVQIALLGLLFCMATDVFGQRVRAPPPISSSLWRKSR